MNRKKFSNKTIKTAGTTRIVITTLSLRQGYRIELFQNDHATKTGWVRVAKLAPLVGTSSLPEFYLRWDDAGNELDVDIHLGGKKRRDLWLKPGYLGHKTKLIDPARRKYEINISIPQGSIFRGTLEVGLLTEMQFSD